jgi:general secretion pathway protein G
MRRRLQPCCLLLALLLLPCLAFGAASTPAQAAKKITLDYQDARFGVVLAEITKAGDFPYVIAGPDIDEDLRVIIRLKDVEPAKALVLVCEAIGFECKMKDGVALITIPSGRFFEIGREEWKTRIRAKEEPTVTIAGREVPVLGAITAGERPPAPGRLATLLAGLDVGSVPPGAASTPAAPSFEGVSKLVDLELKNSPLPEAMAQLSKVSGVEIRVDDSVPKDIRLTANVRKMPLGELLSVLVEQAGLTYSVGEGEITPDAAGRIQVLQHKVETAGNLLGQVQKQHEAGVSTRADVEAAEVALLEEEEKLLEAQRTAGRLPVIFIVANPELRVLRPLSLVPEEPGLAAWQRVHFRTARLEEALLRYALDNDGAPPTTEQGLQALVTKPTLPPLPMNWQGPYIVGIPKDPWGNPFHYKSPGTHAHTRRATRSSSEWCDLASWGADGKPGGEGENADIVNWAWPPSPPTTGAAAP